MKILFITKPISERLDEGSKKNALQIAFFAMKNQFHLMTRSQEKPSLVKGKSDIVFEKVYTKRIFTFYQKLRLLVFLIYENRNIDIYHYFFVPTLISSTLFYYITKLKKKIAIQSVPAFYKHSLKSANIKKLFFADVVVVYSAYTKKKLQDLGLQNVKQIAPGIDINFYYRRPNKNKTRKFYGLPSNKIIVLFSGELTRLNSIDLLLSIIDKVLPSSEEIIFVISCPIRLPEDLKNIKKIEKKIISKQWRKRVFLLKQIEDFSALLSACDIFLYPVSSMVGKIDIPLTVLEAMATELPIILSDIEPLAEIFKSNAGFIVPPGDEIGYVQAILKLSKNASLRTEMGYAARKIVENHYNLKSMIEAYEKLYDEFT